MSGSVGHIREALRQVDKTPADIFPANKITTRCSGCRELIPAGLGYMHYPIGDRKTFCKSCHVAKGLPIRQEVTP